MGEKDKLVLLQVWEESDSTCGVRQDGCSMHIDKQSLDSYISEIYSSRSVGINNRKVPKIYERKVGDPTYVVVSDVLYKELEKNKSIRLKRYEMNNLLNLEEIKVID